MAYKTSELIKKAVKILNDKSKMVHFFEDLCDEMGISKATAYSHKLNEKDSVRDILESNKRTIKKGLRKKWYDSDNPTCQIALYRLTGTDEEREKLNQQYSKTEIKFDFKNLKEKTSEQLIDMLNG